MIPGDKYCGDVILQNIMLKLQRLTDDDLDDDEQKGDNDERDDNDGKNGGQ